MIGILYNHLMMKPKPYKRVVRELPVSVYPEWICDECGVKHGTAPSASHVSTYHIGTDANHTCGWCGRSDVPLTEPRDYGWPKL